MLSGSEYVVIIGQISFVYYSPKSLQELSQYFMDKINEDKAFVIEMGLPTNMNGLPQMIVKPSPGMVMIVQTKQDYERSAGIKKLVGVQ